MQRTQIYLTAAQRQRIARRAADAGTSQAEVIRGILDDALGLDDGRRDRREAVLATAGLLHDAPDWPEWLDQVRGTGAADRLRRLGL
jgi:hypothetical protein